MPTPIRQIQTTDGGIHGIQATGILYGECDSTSTSTAFTAQVPGVSEYYDGLTILLRNGVVTSASNFTININGLGGKPSYSNMATGNDTTPTAPTRDTTIFNINYTMLITYSSDLVDGGAWIMYRGYDANTNTIGYQLRTNSQTMATSSAMYRYRMLFTSADGKKYVPSNSSSATTTASAKTVTTTPIDPFGSIFYYGRTNTVSSGSKPSAAYLWQQYNYALGYAFNRTSAELTMTTSAPVYVKCAPQSDGSAIIDATTPIVQSLPTSEDGKIYIFLGIATSATNVELELNHPVYYYKNGAIREWTNPEDISDIASNITPSMDSGSGAIGTSTSYARADHVHPTDTSRAPLASPSFTGTPTAPTATAGDISGQIANTSFVNSAITTALANITGISFEVFASVSSLPSTGEAGKFYLVNKSGTTNDTYDEYIWYNGGYELIGSTQFTLSTNKASVITSYPGVTTSITPVSSTANAITSVALTNTTNVVTSYPGVTTSFYPAANVTAVTGITYGTTSVYGTGVATVLQSVSPNNSTFSITVSGDELIIGSTVAVSGVTLTSTTTSVANGTSTKVATNATVKSSTNVRGTSITVLSGLGTPDTAGIATSITYGSTAFAKAGTAITVMTGLGTPSTVQAVTNVVQQ